MASASEEAGLTQEEKQQNLDAAKKSVEEAERSLEAAKATQAEVENDPTTQPPSTDFEESAFATESGESESGETAEPVEPTIPELAEAANTLRSATQVTVAAFLDREAERRVQAGEGDGTETAPEPSGEQPSEVG